MKLKLATSDEELQFLYNTRKHPDVDVMLSGLPPKDYIQHLNYIKKVQEKTRWIYVAYERSDLVGYSQIYDVRDNQLEVGFAIHPSHQGKGLGKTLVNETISLAKKEFPNKKIILYVLANNPKAIHVYEKMGFSKYDSLSNEEEIGMVLNK